MHTLRFLSKVLTPHFCTNDKRESSYGSAVMLLGHVTVGGREAAEQEEQLKSLRRDLVNLVCLLGRNQHLRQAVEYENTLMEADFIHALKVWPAGFHSVSVVLK